MNVKRTASFRLFILALALCLVLPLFAMPATAASGKATILLSNLSVYVGDYVYVTVTYSSSVPMATWSFGIQYDSSKLQYVSGAQSTTGGTLNFVDQPTSGGVTSKSYTITFRAKALGSASVSTVTREVYAEDYSTISVSEASRTINVIERPAASGENRLSALSVSGAELSPAFASGTDAYSTTVPYSLNKVEVSATTTHSAASVRVQGAEDLVVGENKVAVIVTAENGNQRTYTINVVREDSKFVGAAVDLDGQTLNFARDPSEVSGVPEGFSPGEGTYGEDPVLLYENATKSACLAALLGEKDAEGKRPCHFYLYDRASGEFAPYVSAETRPQTFVFLNLPEGVELPEGFSPSMLVVLEQEVSAWSGTQKDGRELTLVYATPVDGTAAFYVYDSESGNFSLYQTPVEPEPELSTGGLTMPEMEVALAEETQKNETLRSYLFYGLIAAGALCLILFIVIIILAIVAGKRKRRLKVATGEAQEEERYYEELGIAVGALSQTEEQEPVKQESSTPEPAMAYVLPTEEEGTLEGEEYVPEDVEFPEETLYVPQNVAFPAETLSVDEEVFLPEDDGFMAAPLSADEDADLSEEAIDLTAEPIDLSKDGAERSNEGAEMTGEDDFLVPTAAPQAAPAAEPSSPKPRPIPIWEELDEIAHTAEPTRRRKPVADAASTFAPAKPVPPERHAHPEVERVFGTKSDDEIFRDNNPIIDEDEEDGEDAPIYGFDEE